MSNEQRARELLAAEYAKAYAEPFGAPIDSHAIAVRVIAKALAQQVPADGEWRARDVRYVIAALQSTRDRMMASLTPKFGDALDGDFDVMLDAINELKRWATRLAATPQAPQPVVDATIGQQAVDDDAEMAQQAADEVNPAWWRGNDAAVAILCQKIHAILDGKDDGRGVANEPWESTRRRLLASQPQQGAGDAAGRIKDGDVHAIACALARLDGYDPSDEYGGLYDLRWSGGAQPEPLGDAWSMDYMPKAEKIAAAIGYRPAPPINEAATPQAPRPVVSGTIGQQAVDDACNCPGGSKPASLHAPNCPVRTTENK